MGGPGGLVPGVGVTLPSAVAVSVTSASVVAIGRGVSEALGTAVGVSGPGDPGGTGEPLSPLSEGSDRLAR